MTLGPLTGTGNWWIHPTDKYAFPYATRHRLYSELFILPTGQFRFCCLWTTQPHLYFWKQCQNHAAPRPSMCHKLFLSSFFSLPHSKPSEQANVGFQPWMIELPNQTDQKRLEESKQQPKTWIQQKKLCSREQSIHLRRLKADVKKTKHFSCIRYSMLAKNRLDCWVAIVFRATECWQNSIPSCVHGCLTHTRNQVACTLGRLVFEHQDEAPPKDNGVISKVCHLGKQAYLPLRIFSTSK